MISRADITSLIDEAEDNLRACWDTLSHLRSAQRTRDSTDADLSKTLLDFQPKLARTLYDLSKMYGNLNQEKRSFIAKKADLTPSWFRHRLALLSEYQSAIKGAISLGKRLGDSFAWLFYVSAQDHLLEHGEHQRQFLLPPGVGGLGEVTFIERVQMVGDRLVLYHGITTFLRVGDVSFIDVKDRKVAAIGELKTTKVAKDLLKIEVHMVAPSEKDLAFFAEDPRHRDTDEDIFSPAAPEDEVEARQTGSFDGRCIRIFGPRGQHGVTPRSPCR